MAPSRETHPVEVFQAPNGVTIIVKENHSTPLVSLAMYMRGGVRAENEENQGITNFTQRTIMKGTQTRNAEQIASGLEFLGAQMSPFTGKDVFGATLTALSKHFAEALVIYADCILRALMSSDEVDKERHIIITDIEKKKDDTLSYCLELCERALFEGHPYRFPIAGREDTLRLLGPDALKDWHRLFYRADSMVIALVGDLPASHAKDMLAEVFADLPPGKNSRLPTDAREERLCTVRELVEVSDKRQVAVALGFHGPAFGDPDYYAFDVLDHVLSGMGSRLFIELRDKQGLGYMVNCHFDSRRDVGAFKIYIGTSEDRRERSRQAMLEELDRLRRQPVSADELERTQQYMLGLHEIALQRNGAQASRLAYYEIMGPGWRLLDEYPQRILSVTSEDVQNAARRYLDVEHYAIAQVICS